MIIDAWVDKKALKMFKQIELSHTNPKKVTFISVISYCCNVGLVDDGWCYFEKINKYYGMKHVVEHYCSIVDILSHVGRLDKA